MKTTAKKLLTLALCLLLLGSVMLPAGAEDETPEETVVTLVESGPCGAEGSDVNYALYSDGTLIVSGRGEIKDNAFSKRNIKKIVIQEGITAIGKEAFYDINWNLESISLPDSLISIGESAFYEKMFDAIQFGSGLESIGPYAFCYSYASQEPADRILILPDSVKTIEIQAFCYCNLLKMIVVGPNAEFVHGSAFANGRMDLETLVYLNGNPTSAAIQGCETVYSYAGGYVETLANNLNRPFVDLTTIEETDHDWTEGTITRLPTCTAPGEMTYLCKTNPSHRKTEPIPMTGHVWCETTTAATCTESGETTRTCIYCGASSSEPIPAAGHAWDAGVVTKAPTCTESGVKTYTCQCGATYTESLAALGHTAPNSDGVCERCGAHLCHWCGKEHGSGFDAVIAWIHSLLAKIFGARY